MTGNAFHNHTLSFNFILFALSDLAWASDTAILAIGELLLLLTSGPIHDCSQQLITITNPVIVCVQGMRDEVSSG